MDNTNQVTYWRPTNMRRHFTKCNRYGDRNLCTPVMVPGYKNLGSSFDTCIHRPETDNMKDTCSWNMHSLHSGTVPLLTRLVAKLSRRRPDSIPGQSLWDLWRTKWQWATCFCRYLSYPRQYHSTNISYLYFIHPPSTSYNLSIWQRR
jgi:hypothetical protein